MVVVMRECRREVLTQEQWQLCIPRLKELLRWYKEVDSNLGLFIGELH
jgi:hypothetical protein